ncbi:unnamed protein product [Soboliphyme baturini]|uniref:Uncharacterized protein n=1 Tax=Soboliphyme baturini TaxID=241478 RepID=A0A183J0B7_9BILA|nr:unnamed protein product [Soboliphyme baturini]
MSSSRLGSNCHTQLVFVVPFRCMSVPWLINCSETLRERIIRNKKVNFMVPPEALEAPSVCATDVFNGAAFAIVARFLQRVWLHTFVWSSSSSSSSSSSLPTPTGRYPLTHSCARETSVRLRRSYGRPVLFSNTVCDRTTSQPIAIYNVIYDKKKMRTSVLSLMRNGLDLDLTVDCKHRHHPRSRIEARKKRQALNLLRRPFAALHLEGQSVPEQ